MLTEWSTYRRLFKTPRGHEQRFEPERAHERSFCVTRRRLLFDEQLDPDEDGEHVVVRRIERDGIRVTIEAAAALATQLALARDLHQEIQLWFELDSRRGA